MKRVKSKNKFIVWILAIPLVAASIVTTVEMASSGAELSLLTSQEAALRSENQRLGAELVSASSLSQFENTYESLGFIRPEKIIYITEEEAVAKLP
ncbi:hypothetical protein HYT60_01530 [Candidatus Woesebacteria bacterium]|nr:hypothetical protein [Candidatus Woesebacteria bacterium]